MNIANLLFKGLEVSDDHNAWISIIRKHGYSSDIAMINNVACAKNGELWKRIDLRRQGKIGWGDTYRNSCDNIGVIYLGIIQDAMYGVAKRVGLEGDNTDQFDFNIGTGGSLTVLGEHIDSLAKFEEVIINGKRGYLRA